MLYAVPVSLPIVSMTISIIITEYNYFVVQMVILPLLDLKYVSTTTLPVPSLETVAITLLLFYHVQLRKSMKQAASYFNASIFSDVRCGQLHCRDSGNFRLTVGSESTRPYFVPGQGFVRCKYV